MSENLKEIREKIDAVDDEIANLFGRRMELVREVAEIKANSSLPLVNSNREKEIVQRVSASVVPEIQKFAVRLYETLFAVSKEYQNELINLRGKDGKRK